MARRHQPSGTFGERHPLRALEPRHVHRTRASLPRRTSTQPMGVSWVLGELLGSATSEVDWGHSAIVKSLGRRVGTAPPQPACYAGTGNPNLRDLSRAPGSFCSRRRLVLARLTVVRRSRRARRAALRCCPQRSHSSDHRDRGVPFLWCSLLSESRPQVAVDQPSTASAARRPISPFMRAKVSMEVLAAHSISC